MDEIANPEDLQTIHTLLGMLEGHKGSMVIGYHGGIWTLAMVMEGDEMTVSGFDTGDELTDVLDSVVEQLEMF